MSLVDPIRYNELPSLEEAEVQRQAQHVNHVINGPLREVFIQHGAQNAFSLYLSHRHHQVRDDEAVVKVQSTAHLMSNGDMRDIEAVGNKIIPMTWMGREMLPMEFAAVPNSAKTPVISSEFVADLVNVLAANGCEGLFGIDTLLEEDWMELSIGNASVVVPSDGNERDEAYIPVALAFDDKTSGFRVHGKCGKDHKHTSKP